jgi:hypothetical protein
LQQRRELLWVLLLALLVLPFALTHPVQKHYSGFQALALEILGKAAPGTRILVSSDASGEGMFISELAMRDQRPNLIVERGSKTLVDPDSQSWSGRGMRLRFGEDADLLQHLLTSKIEYIVLDAAVPAEKQTAYHDQLRRILEDDRTAGTFWRNSESPITRDGEDLAPPLRLYRIMRKQDL